MCLHVVAQCLLMYSNVFLQLQLIYNKEGTSVGRGYVVFLQKEDLDRAVDQSSKATFGQPLRPFKFFSRQLLLARVESDRVAEKVRRLIQLSHANFVGLNDNPALKSPCLLSDLRDAL